MRMRFPEEVNGHLVNLMTIARHDGTPQNCAAVQQELLHGQALLLVQAEPSGEDGRKINFKYVAGPEGQVTLFVFTGQAAVRTFAQEDLTLMIIPSGAFFRSCAKNGVGVVVVDPRTPNELRIGLSGPQDQ